MPDPTTLTTAAATHLVKGPLQRACETAGQKYTAAMAKQVGKSLPKSLAALRLVKTLWQIDKKVDILQFYYPSRLIDKASTDGRTFDIHTLDDLADNNHALILGTVGQGKSMLLRYLAWQEATVRKRFPIFVELRTLRSKTTIFDAIQTFLLDHHINIDRKGFIDAFLTNGNVTVFLDGFDEIPKANRPKIVDELDSLATRYAATQFVITSRPDARIASSPHFRNYDLAPLTPKDHEPILKKLIDDSDKVNEILRQIRESSSSIVDLLTTPLLVTLLVVNFRATNRIPQSFTGFYGDLFKSLLVRHDDSKPGGVVRDRDCGLGKVEMEQVFDAVSFQSRKRRRVELSRSEMQEVLDLATRARNVSCDIWKYLSDIESTVCLILSDGDQYRYIHKSIQEFHAAQYVRDLSDKKAESFYKQMRSKGAWRDEGSWAQVVRFLKNLDQSRFKRLFELPSRESFFIHVLQRNPKSVEHVSDSAIRRFFASMSSLYLYTLKETSIDKARTLLIPVPACVAKEYGAAWSEGSLVDEMYKIVDSKPELAISSGVVMPEKDLTKGVPSDWLVLDIDKCLDHDDFAKDFRGIGVKFIREQFELLAALREEVDIVDGVEDDLLDDL